MTGVLTVRFHRSARHGARLQRTRRGVVHGAWAFATCPPATAKGQGERHGAARDRLEATRGSHDHDYRVLQPQGRRREDHDAVQRGYRDGTANRRVLMVDLDGQANLTAIALNDEQLIRLYPSAPQVSADTVAGVFAPLVSGAGDVAIPSAVEVRKDMVWLLPGDIQLSAFESILPGRINSGSPATSVASG